MHRQRNAAVCVILVSACGDSVLQMAIAELDSSGFSDDAAGVWKGEILWQAFKQWKAGINRPQTAKVGKKPDLYAR